MGQTLQCIRHCARLVEDQANVLEASRLWKNLGANPPSACSSRDIENNNLCFGGADDQAQAHTEMVHAVQQQLQP